MWQLHVVLVGNGGSEVGAGVVRYFCKTRGSTGVLHLSTCSAASIAAACGLTTHCVNSYSTGLPVKRKSFNQLHLCSSQSRHSFSARSDTVIRAVVTVWPCFVSQLNALFACCCLEQVTVMLLMLAQDAARHAVETKAHDVSRSVWGTYCSSTAMTSGGSSGTCRDRTVTSSVIAQSTACRCWRTRKRLGCMTCTTMVASCS